MMVFHVEQGDETYDVEPLSYQDLTIEEFYNYRGVRASADTPTNVEDGAEKSKLFLYEGPEGVSLVIIHDYHNYPGSTASGGEATFAFSGLDGSWVIEDDSGDWDRSGSPAPDEIHWRWNARNTDGGAFRFDSEEFSVTVDPNFHHGISGWELLSGDADDPERIDLKMEEAATISSGPAKTSVSASVTTLQFIPGQEENPTRGGHPLNSGLMQVFPEDERWGVWGALVEANADPVFDSWMGGDMTDVLPENLDEARREIFNKYVDDRPEESFKEYRFENEVSVSFETTGDGSIDEDTIEIAFSEAGTSGDDPLVVRGDRGNSMTVLHDHELNGIPWEGWYGENVQSSWREPRFYEHDTDFEFDGVEGVRVVTIWGGWAGFMRDISDRTRADPVDFLSTIWDWGPALTAVGKLALLAAPQSVDYFLDVAVSVPRTWSFLDFVVLADGRRYVRVWDAPQYPSLYTYVDGRLQAADDMPYAPGQLVNKSMFAFHLRAAAGLTPYNLYPITHYASFIRQNPVQRGELARTIGDAIDRLRLGWAVDELMPTIPRETLGFDGNASAEDTEPLDDPDGPFPRAEGMFFPLVGVLPPE